MDSKMARASTTVHMVEQAPQNGCLQHLCPQGSPTCLLHLQKALHDQQLVLTQAFFKLQSLGWNSEHVRFCVHPLRVEYLFPTALQLS